MPVEFISVRDILDLAFTIKALVDEVKENDHDQVALADELHHDIARLCTYIDRSSTGPVDVNVNKELRDLKVALSGCLKRIRALVYSRDGFIRRFMRKNKIRSEIEDVRQTVDKCYRRFLISMAIVTAQGVRTVDSNMDRDIQKLVSVLRQEIRLCFRDAIKVQSKVPLATRVNTLSPLPTLSWGGKYSRLTRSDRREARPLLVHDKDRLKVKVDALIENQTKVRLPITRSSSSSSSVSIYQGHPITIPPSSPGGPSPDAASKSLQLLDKLSGTPWDSKAVARSLTELVILLSDLGLARSACQVAGKSVEVHHSLMKQDPSFKASYAGSLNTYAALLTQTRSEPQLAYTTSEKAVVLFRILQKESPGMFEASCASALNNHSNALCIIGHYSQALQAILQSVDIRRRLVSCGSYDSSPSLSHSLHNLASCVRDIGDRREAVHIITEATDIARALAHEDPTFDEASATCLLTLSHCLVHVGRHREALVAVRKSIGIRQTARSREAVARRAPLLSEAFSQLSVCHKAMKDYPEALDAIEQAVRLDRSYVEETQEHPDANAEARDMLAFDLYRMSMRFADLGRKEDAIEAMEESIAHREQIVRIEPDADLAAAFHDLAVLYFNTARYVESRLVAGKAVAIRRALASTDWTRYGPMLRNSTRVLEKIRSVVSGN